MICPTCGWSDQDIDVQICLACGDFLGEDYPPQWRCKCQHTNPSGTDECELCGLSYDDDWP